MMALGSAQRSGVCVWGFIPVQVQLFPVMGLNLTLISRGEKSEPQTTHFQSRCLNDSILGVKTQRSLLQKKLVGKGQ